MRKLVGADASGDRRAEKVDAMIDGHFASLRANPRYRHSYIVLCLESNYGGSVVADRLGTHLSRTFGPMWVRNYDPKGKGLIGIWTDPTMKESYTNTLENMISNNVLHSVPEQEFVTTQCNKVTGAKEPNKVLEKLYKQLAQYRKETSYKDDKPFLIPKTIITGKAPQQKDDLAFALSMSVHWNVHTRKDSSFIRFAALHGYILG